MGLLELGRFVVGVDSGCQVGLQPGPGHARRVAVVPAAGRDRQLAAIWASPDVAPGKFISSPRPTVSGQVSISAISSAPNRAPGLSHGAGRHAGRGGEPDMQRQRAGPRRAWPPARQPGDVGQLMRVGDDQTGAARDHRPGKLRDPDERAFQMDMWIDEGRRDRPCRGNRAYSAARPYQLPTPAIRPSTMATFASSSSPVKTLAICPPGQDQVGLRCAARGHDPLPPSCEIERCA